MGFKVLTPDNWKQPDPTSTQFWQVSQIAGRPMEMDGDDWARAFLAVDLKGHVPEDVRNLFVVARGTLLYGWFYYPLFRVGEEQLYRVVEAATKACYRAAGGTQSSPTFHAAVAGLVAAGVIPEEDEERWTAARRLRNLASHPERQAAMPPGAVLGMLRAAAHDINRLFARSAQLPDERPVS